jgi:hypothetical protein
MMKEDPTDWSVWLDDDLDLVRARDAVDSHLDPRDGAIYAFAIQTIRDRRALLAEVDRLTAEQDALLKQIFESTTRNMRLINERDVLRAEINRLNLMLDVATKGPEILGPSIEMNAHPFTCGVCSWGRDGAYHGYGEYEEHMAAVHPEVQR